MWSREEATVRDVLDALNDRNAKRRAYTTVMTVMGRLSSKGVLTRRRDGRIDVYKPAMSREEYRSARASAEFGAFVDTYGDLALVQFARHIEELDPQRREELARLARRD